MRIPLNNIIAMLILLFNIFTVYNFVLIHEELKPQQLPKEKISGFVTSATLNLCIGATNGPIITIFHPQQGSILNGTQKLTANLTNTAGLTDVTLNFSYLNSSVTVEIGTDSYDSDYDFNVSWNTSQVADGNHNYQIKITGTSTQTDCQGLVQ